MNFKLSKDSNIFILIRSYFINCSSQVLADFCLDNQQALARVEDHNFVFTISILYFILLYAITQMRKLKEALYLLSHLAITGTAAIWNASTHRDSFPRFLGILWIQWERCFALFPLYFNQALFLLLSLHFNSVLCFALLTLVNAQTMLESQQHSLLCITKNEALCPWSVLWRYSVRRQMGEGLSVVETRNVGKCRCVWANGRRGHQRRRALVSCGEGLSRKSGEGRAKTGLLRVHWAVLVLFVIVPSPARQFSKPKLNRYRREERQRQEKEKERRQCQSGKVDMNELQVGSLATSQSSRITNGHLCHWPSQIHFCFHTRRLFLSVFLFSSLFRLNTDNKFFFSKNNVFKTEDARWRSTV